MSLIRRFAAAALAWVLAVGFFDQSARGDGPDLAAKLRPFVERQTLAGAVVLVASADEVLDLEAVGFADVAAKTPMTTDALFWIASMNKAMTAAGLMMLVDEGKLTLDDPVEKHLPEFRGQMRLVEKDTNLVVLKKPARAVRVRDLLCHTAGLVGRSPLERELDILPLREAVITYALSPLQVDPGTKYQYNNPGINTAGRLIEVLSGKPYEVFMQERLFDPLGMKETTFWPSESQLKRLAKAYRPGPNRTGLFEVPIGQLTYPLTDRTRRYAYPAGGLFSTASDVGAFCRMILGGGSFGGRRLLSASAVREMTSTQTGDLLNGGKGEQGYGLGWNTARKSPGESGPAVAGRCEHGGAFATQMVVDPTRGRVYVFLVQHDGYPLPDGNRAYPAFLKAAEEAFAKP